MASLLINNLGIICPVCDFLNTAASRQCSSCGQTLLETQPAIQPAQFPPLTPQRPTPSSANIQAPTQTPSSPALPKITPPQPQAAPLPPHVPPTNTPGAMLYAATHTDFPPGSYSLLPSTYPPAQPPVQPPVQPQQRRSSFKHLSTFTSKPYTLLALAGTYRGQRFALNQKMHIGRTRGQLLFVDDPFVSPVHASLWIHNQQIYVRDENSLSGVYASIQNQETIVAQQKFCVGMRLFRYIGQLPPTPPYIPGRLVIHGTPVPAEQANYAIEEILVGDRPGRTFVSAGPSIFIGSTKCDLSYSLDDGLLAARHCELIPMPQTATLRDLSNGLGTYVRIAGDRLLRPGDRLRIGQQTLQLEAPV